MKLFKCHAVLPLQGQQHEHVVRTYVSVAPTWQEARSRVGNQEALALFVTVPCEMPDVLLIGLSSMSQRELADLKSASHWNEHRLADEGVPLPTPSTGAIRE